MNVGWVGKIAKLLAINSKESNKRGVLLRNYSLIFFCCFLFSSMADECLDRCFFCQLPSFHLSNIDEYLLCVCEESPLICTYCCLMSNYFILFFTSANQNSFQRTNASVQSAESNLQKKSSQKREVILKAKKLQRSLS